MNQIVFYYKRTEEELFKSFNIIRFYHTRYGLKNVGGGYLIGANRIPSGTTVELPTEGLFLGPDYLKNKFTLLNCCISQSPHFGFIKTIMEGGSLSETDYIQRFIRGRLDWRRGTTTSRDFSYFINMYSRSLNEIKDNDYSPIIVYSLNGKYYIYDGKHRAALCANLGLPVRCQVVGSEIANANVWHYMFTIIKDNPEYSLHTEFHNTYLNELNEYGKQ